MYFNVIKISYCRFYKNSYYISSKFELINKYLDYTIQKMKLYKNITNSYSSYKLFNNELETHIDKLSNFHNLMKSLQKTQIKPPKLYM